MEIRHAAGHFVWLESDSAPAVTLWSRQWSCYCSDALLQPSRPILDYWSVPIISVTLWTLPWEKQQACSMVTIWESISCNHEILSYKIKTTKKWKWGGSSHLSFLSCALLNHCRGHEDVYKYNQMQHCGPYSQKAKAHPAHNECFPTTTGLFLQIKITMSISVYNYQTRYMQCSNLGIFFLNKVRFKCCYCERYPIMIILTWTPYSTWETKIAVEHWNIHETGLYFLNVFWAYVMKINVILNH